MMLVRVLTAGVGIVVITACQTSRSARPVSTVAGKTTVAVLSQPQSRAEAQATASALLASVRLPPGALPRAAPIPQLTDLGSESAVITRVEDKSWSTVAATADQLSASIGADPLPAQVTCPGAGMGTFLGPAEEQVSHMSCREQQRDSPSVDIYAVRLGERLGVLVDVSVIWVPPKTSVDTVPSGLASARLTFNSGVSGLKDRSMTISGRQLTTLAAAINNDTVAPPQSMPNSCPPGQGEATLTVSRRVNFQIDIYGCRGVTVYVDGKAETTLDYDPAPGATAHQVLDLPHYSWPPGT